MPRIPARCRASSPTRWQQFSLNKANPLETTSLPATFPWRTDFQHPTVFWITNGWNEFVGNMAAGAGACGAAYWLVPSWNSDMADVPTKRRTSSSAGI